MHQRRALAGRNQIREILPLRLIVEFGQIDFGVGRDNRQRTNFHVGLRGDERHQSPEADQVAEQFLYVIVIAVLRGKEKSFGRAGRKVEAQKTQAWQLLYFIEIEPNIDHAKMQRLLSQLSIRRSE